MLYISITPARLLLETFTYARLQACALGHKKGLRMEAYVEFIYIS